MNRNSTLKGVVLLSAGLILTCLPTGCSSDYELQWHQDEGYRWAEISPGMLGSTGFKLHGERTTGISFSNDVGRERIAENRHYLNGSGVAVADVDGDGLQDIYFAGLEGSNRLYRNLGNFRFEDITEQAGVPHQGYHSTGVVFADVDGDGHPDLLITSLDNKNALYMNNGEGYFILKEDSGLGDSRGAMTMTLADINGNGYPDLYITNYKLRTIRDRYSAEELSYENTMDVIDGEPVIKPPFENDLTIVETAGGPYRNEIGAEDELYINRGDGVFEKVNPPEYFFDENGDPAGLSDDWGLTATFRDVNGDGAPDLYVANDFWTPDRFWMNRGDGRFRAIGSEAIPNLSFSSMGTDFSDINRDGYIDFVVTEMLSRTHGRRTRQFSDFLDEYNGQTLYNRNSVYLNRKDTTFAQIAYYSGLEASEWSWATIFSDIDLDGYEDLIVATGYGNDFQDLDTQLALYERDMGGRSAGREGDVLDYPPLALQNKIFRNNGDLTFSEVSSQWGFEGTDISTGMALADLDNNGTPDLILNRFNDKAQVYENRSNAPRIAVRLNGRPANTQAIGAEIKLEGGAVVQTKQVKAGGDYLSGSQPQAVFAASEGFSGHKLTVTWPDGGKTDIENVQDNRIYEIDENSPAKTTPEAAIPEEKDPLFRDVSSSLSHRHHENSYDDFRFGPLLPLQLSRLGPGAAWIDINQDGTDELLITSGKDGRPSVFETAPDGNFSAIQYGLLTSEVPGDQPSILGWQENGEVKIVTGNANYEQGDPSVPSAFIYSVQENGEISREDIPGTLSTTGPVAAADYNGDGYVDLFVGGRHKPGQYPGDADSRLFRNGGGSFETDRQNSALFMELGLVTDALFADITGNGHPDLLVSTGWGSLRLFENSNGTFSEVTRQTGLAEYKGWWNGVAVGDFTGNGLADIVALNIGRNSPYQIKSNQPLRLYYSDFDWNGRLDILDAYYDEETGGYVPRRKLYDFESVSTILTNVQSHSEYSRATVEEIFDQDFTDVSFKEIDTLDHMVFLNTGEGFEAKPLPAEAQFSAGFYAGITDFDNDGQEDLFISQNFFSFPDFVPRLDAGRGLLLRGDGSGNFKPLSGDESGIKIYGEQRGAALGDFNEDGKTDLAVSRNNGRTALYENKAQKNGIRVRLEGPPANADAVGSSVRLVYEDGSKGPRRYIQAGGGYGSQNSYTQVLGFDPESTPEAAEVTWFDREITVMEISPTDNVLVISRRDSSRR